MTIQWIVFTHVHVNVKFGCGIFFSRVEDIGKDCTSHEYGVAHLHAEIAKRKPNEQLDSDFKKIIAFYYHFSQTFQEWQNLHEFPVILIHEPAFDWDSIFQLVSVCIEETRLIAFNF